MTSTANAQNLPAPNPSAPSATASYASAAGASGKIATTSAIASGSQGPLVVSASSATPTQPGHHAKSLSVSPLNGSAANKSSNTANMAANNGQKHNIVPAIPAVVNGSAIDHARKNPVTMNIPRVYGANGGPAGPGPKHSLKFGSESPVVVHSTPSQNPSAPVPIPNQQRIPSPVHSPSPIPIPSASGGRPPSNMSQDGPKFGSLGGDGDRHMKQHPAANLPGGQSPHFRRGSTHSIHSDMGNHAGHGNHGPHGNHPHHGGPANRGNYGAPPGRGRGYNTGHFNQSMAYPPGGSPYRAASQGRGGMPAQFQPRGMQPAFGQNSPQAARASPAMSAVVPNNSTPLMQAAIPANTGVNNQFMNNYYQQAPGFPPQVNNYQPYNPAQFNNQGMMSYAYSQVPYMAAGPQQSPGSVYAPPYVPNPYTAPGPQPMSRNNSQVSERPNSSTGPMPPAAGAIPVAPAAAGGLQKGAPSGMNFIVPSRKSAAIVIRNPQGEIQDYKKESKPPASPGPNVPVTKTPPAAALTPTPPPKSVTPSHGRTESASAARSVEELRNEFKIKGQAAAAAAAATTTEPAKPATPTDTTEKTKPAEEKQAEVKKPEDKAVAEKKPEEKKEEKKAPEATPAPAATAAADEEDEVERMIREMEEEDARREAEAAAYNQKKKLQDAENKKKADADRAASAAENDRKLREQEREMERLEEEREKKRNAKETGADQPKTVAEMLTAKITDLTSGDRKESHALSSPTAASGTDAITQKLGSMKLSGGQPSPSSETSAGTKQQKAKPSALNLTPLMTKSVEPPQPSAALQSLKTARFLRDPTLMAYPKGIQSPNPALNPAVNKKGNFKYDMGFLLQFKDVFTEKPSLDFDQQVKQLIGDGESTPRPGSRTPASGPVRQNSRTAASGAFGSGMMGEFASKTLPPGTTSEQRFAMSSGTMPRPPAVSGMSQFGRPGSFPGPSHMTRTPSASMGGAVPNSPRQGSRSTRGNSRRDNFGSKNDAKTMPLTAGQELKPIVVTASGWKPTSIGNRAMASSAVGPSGVMDPPMVQRKVKAALNKMTPEKFDKISDQILTIALQSKDEEDGRTLRQVIQLTFEKATDEAHWAPMYARFCKRMLDMMSPEIRDTTIKDKKGDVISGGTLFRKYLLNRCQEEFERGWMVDLPEPKEGESREAVMLSDEYYEAAAAKRRGLGLVQFIGELYKLGMLTERIMHECVRKLVDYEVVPDEAEIESLSKLLRTVGGNLDATEKGRPMMDAYFLRIKNMIDIPELPSRLKFMLMDIVDLRSNHWVSSDKDKGPKTLDEVRLEAEAAAAQKAAEAARSTSQRGQGSIGGRGGRGDGRQFSYNQPAQNQVGMDDLRRLKAASRVTSTGMTTLGPTSMFASRSNSGRRNGPGGSFGRPGDDSGPGSRTGTPPTRTDSNSVSHSNAFEALANVDTETPASPPSTAASPALAKVNLDKLGAKKDGN